MSENSAVKYAMKRAVVAFNTLTGQSLTEVHGWLFIAVVLDHILGSYITEDKPVVPEDTVPNSAPEPLCGNFQGLARLIQEWKDTVALSDAC